MKKKRKNEKPAKPNKNYYSSIKRFDQHSHSKNYSDTDYDGILTLSEDDDDKNNDYVNPSAKSINKKSQWQPVSQTAKTPEIIDIPFVTAQNMKKTYILPFRTYIKCSSFS